MDTSFERIHAKIANLEAKIADLRIAERDPVTDNFRVISPKEFRVLT